jgi:hypothetical protein
MMLASAEEHVCRFGRRPSLVDVPVDERTSGSSAESSSLAATTSVLVVVVLHETVPAISRGSESEPVVAGTRRRSGSPVASVTDRPACSRQRSSSSLGSLAEWRPPLAHTVAPRSSGKRCLVALIGEHLAG